MAQAPACVAPERRHWLAGRRSFNTKPLAHCLAGSFCQNAASIGPSLSISVYFQWLKTSSRSLTEQGETCGLAGKNRENLEPLQGELVPRRQPRRSIN